MLFDNFDQLPWHDAELLSISVDRSDPGNDDSVTLLVRWPNSQKNQIIFRECYAFDVEMNFGVIATESIREGRCWHECDKLLEIREKWKILGVNLNDLYCYHITTNSTNSCLKIYAKKYEHSPLL